MNYKFSQKTLDVIYVTFYSMGSFLMGGMVAVYFERNSETGFTKNDILFVFITLVIVMTIAWISRIIKAKENAK